MTALLTRIYFSCYAFVLLNKLSDGANVNSECKSIGFIPRNCEIYQWQGPLIDIRQGPRDGMTMSCNRPFVDSLFSSQINSELSSSCLAKIIRLNYICEDAKRRSDLTNVTFNTLPNLEELYISNCNFNKLFHANLAASHKLRSIEIYKTEELNIYKYEAERAINLLIEPLSIIQLTELKKLHVTGNNVDMLPEGEFCNLNLFDLDFRNNALTNIYSLNFGQSNLKDNRTCGQNLGMLTLASNYFHSLPSRGFSNLINLASLDLSNNKLSMIHEDAFQNLKNLQFLDLDYNLITNITSIMWSDMTGLVSLRLVSNRITTIAFENMPKILTIDLTSNLFGKVTSFPLLESLDTLHLGKNVITTIYDDAFMNASGLLFLHLNSNKISRISRATFTGIENITHLYLSDNNIANISGTTFSRLEKLEHLDLSGNRINYIDITTFYHCPILSDVYLSGNHLKQVPDFSHSLNILQIDISRNEISSLSENCFANLTKLLVLNMERNKLSEIPILLFPNSHELKTLFLNNNFLVEISDDMFKHINATEELYLNNNFLKAIPDLKSLTYLDKLELQYNNISNLDFELLSHSIVTLNASHNSIATFNYSLEYRVGNNLKTLDVSYNKLSDAPFIFSLTYLNVSNNNITYLEHHALQWMDSIEEVDLRYNKLATLFREEFIHNENNGILLEGNLMRCDCTTWWLKNVPSINGARIKYSLIKDLDRVNCTVRLMGSEDTQEMALIHAPDDRFLCEFKQDADQVTLNSQVECVDGCYCYFNHDWSVVVTYCSYRKLHSVPRDMPSESVIIYLDGNNIKTLARPSLDDYASAARLFINFSQVEIIEDNVFGQMSRLQQLHLENNRLENLSEETFAGLHNLMVLYLQSNVLHFLHPGVFLTPGGLFSTFM